MYLKVNKRKDNLKICESTAKMLQHQPFEIPDEVVREILIWLPVEFLARFKSVSKAWLAIISDPSFVPAHLQCSKKKEKQNPSSFLITPHILLHFPAGEFGAVAPMAHCDGLLLLPTDTKVYVFNPATKDAIALPQSQRNMMRHYGCLSVGLGLDTSTGKYKVARTFHRSCDDGPMEIFTMGMEVFTINGENGSWRETSVDLPYPILGSQAGIYCKGCLFFFIDKNNQQIPPQRLLRFSLLDETFGVTPLLTNLYPSVDDEDIFVNELDGELCASLFSKVLQRVLIFTTSHVVDPRWDIRYIINVDVECDPMASLGSSRILLRHGCRVFRYNLKTGRLEEGEIFDMRDIRYLGPGEDALGHAWENLSWFDLISYTESLVPVTLKASSWAL
ncbi:hypothetical protein HU200_063000 [Digitaria exilis]|uniref:F-box domain-containing protein n=1 Tax=Digitaria exilis TaxID=1010633 RepID=A0A835AEH8_9POAL|nr:hypothetical protein HU200_063000 [Digitaria exilis]